MFPLRATSSSLPCLFDFRKSFVILSLIQFVLQIHNGWSNLSFLDAARVKHLQCVVRLSCLTATRIFLNLCNHNSSRAKRSPEAVLKSSNTKSHIMRDFYIQLCKQLVCDNVHVLFFIPLAFLVFIQCLSHFSKCHHGAAQFYFKASVIHF